jgi:superfamily I DNA and/or RNA helicase
MKLGTLQAMGLSVINDCTQGRLPVVLVLSAKHVLFVLPALPGVWALVLQSTLEGQVFDVVLLDEASQMTEPTSLVSTHTDERPVG